MSECTKPSNYSTTTSHGTQVEKDSSNIRKIIILKLVLVVVTMSGGAVLALTINVWMDRTMARSDYWMSEIEEKDFKTDKNGKRIRGQFRNRKTGECMDTLNQRSTFYSHNGPLAVDYCHDGLEASQQAFVFTKNGEIRQDKYCADGRPYKDLFNHLVVEMAPCREKREGQVWQWENNSFKFHDGKLCLAAQEINENEPLILENCQEGRTLQIWEIFDNYY